MFFLMALGTNLGADIVLMVGNIWCCRFKLLVRSYHSYIQWWFCRSIFNVLIVGVAVEEEDGPDSSKYEYTCEGYFSCRSMLAHNDRDTCHRHDEDREQIK